MLSKISGVSCPVENVLLFVKVFVLKFVLILLILAFSFIKEKYDVFYIS